MQLMPVQGTPSPWYVPPRLAQLDGNMFWHSPFGRQHAPDGPGPALARGDWNATRFSASSTTIAASNATIDLCPIMDDCLSAGTAGLRPPEGSVRAPAASVQPEHRSHKGAD